MAEGSSLTCSGSRIIPLHFGPHRFDWPFQLAPVFLPALRADFYCHHRFLQEITNQRVFSPVSPGSPKIMFCLSALSSPASMQPFSPLPSASQPFFPSSLPFFLLMVLPPLCLAIRSTITCLLALQFLQNPAVGFPEAGILQGQVLHHGEGRDHRPFYISSPYA